MPPRNPPLPFASRTPLSAYFSLRTEQRSRELARLGGEGAGKPRGPQAPPERPQQRPSPLRHRRAAPVSESSESLGGAQTNAAQPTAPWAGEGGEPRLLFAETFSLCGRS